MKMRNLKILLGVQALGTFGINQARYTKDKKEKRKMVLILLGAAAMAIFVMGISFLYTYLIVKGMLEFERAIPGLSLSSTIPTALYAASSIMILFTTLYKAGGTLFPKYSEDMLFSLPILNREIVLAKLISMYAYDLLFTLGVLLPAGAAYVYLVRPGYGFILRYVLALPFVPLIPLAIGTLLSFLVFAIAARFPKGNNMLITVLSMIMVLAFSLAPQFLLGGQSADGLALLFQGITAQIARLYPPARLFSQAVEGPALHALAYYGVSVLAFALPAYVVIGNYRAIVDRVNGVSARASFKMGKIRKSSPFMALMRRELRMLGSIPIYMLNTISVPVLSVGVGLVLYFMGPEKLAVLLEIPGLAHWLWVLSPLLISTFLCISPLTAPSVSLEGKRLWILTSLPVSAAQKILAKAALNVGLVLPSVLINGILFALTLRPSPLITLMMFITPTAYLLFSSLGGLVCGLHFVNLNWTSESAVVKRGAATFVAMIMGIAALAPAYLAVLYLPRPEISLLCATGAILMISLAFYGYLLRRGNALFTALSEM